MTLQASLSAITEYEDDHILTTCNTDPQDLTGFTVPSDCDCMVITWGSWNTTSNTITWDQGADVSQQSMVQAVTHTATNTAEIWYVLNPHAGAHTLRIDWATTQNEAVAVYAIYLKNVHQGGDTFTVSATDTDGNGENATTVTATGVNGEDIFLSHVYSYDSADPVVFNSATTLVAEVLTGTSSCADGNEQAIGYDAVGNTYEQGTDDVKGHNKVHVGALFKGQTEGPWLKASDHNANGAAAHTTSSAAQIGGIGPTAGNLLVLVLAVDKGSGAIGAPTNGTWILVHKEEGASVSGAMWYKFSDGVDDSFTVSWANPQNSSKLSIMEFGGVDTFDNGAEDAESTESTSKSSGTTTALKTSINLAVAAICIDTANNAFDNGAFSNGYTTELSLIDNSHVGLTISYHLSVGTAATSTAYSWDTDPGDQMYGVIGSWYFAVGGVAPESLINRRRFQGTRPRDENLLTH